MPRYDVVLTPLAARDIDAIADQTIARWGKRQARTYVSALRADIESLGVSPERYQRHDGNSLGLRCMRSGHHLLFYWVGSTSVEIVRVLHERMDVDERLGTSPT